LTATTATKSHLLAPIPNFIAARIPIRQRKHDPGRAFCKSKQQQQQQQ